MKNAPAANSRGLCIAVDRLHHKASNKLILKEK